MAGWVAVAVAGFVMLTQALGWPGTRTIAILQSLTPYLALAMAPVAAAALTGRRIWMAFTASLIGIAGLILALPVLFPADLPPTADGAASLRIGALNLLYLNEPANVEDVAADLAERDLDVIVFAEYSTAHQRVLQGSDLAAEYPFRIDRSGLGAGGIAVWSRTAVIVHDHPDTTNYSLDLSVRTADGLVRVLAVHPPTPVANFDAWKRDLDHFGELGLAGSTPTVVIGDFNASFWHPGFRDLLDAGLTDAHIALGHGFATSWPADRWYPPFVRLDHALTTDGLVPTAVEDFAIAGSDHRGLVVTVAPAR